MNRTFSHYLCLIGGLALGLTLGPSVMQAQDTAVIHACYVPTTGLIYRIKETGLQQTCLAETHVEFTLAAGVLGGARIGPNVQAPSLDQVVGLNTAAAGAPAAAGTPIGGFFGNGDLTVAGIVESQVGGFKFPDATTQTTAAGAWADLTGVPAGFADGVDDDTQYTDADAVAAVEAGDLTVAGDVTATDFVGDGSGLTNLPASTHELLNNNIGVGVNALQNATAIDNTAVGRDALKTNTTGPRNTAMGYKALESNTSGERNVAIGDRALSRNTGSAADQNTAVGSSALQNNTSQSNTAVGYASLTSNTTGFENTAIGASTLDGVTGSRNTAVGKGALGRLSGGSGNIALGYNAGNNAINTASDNIFIASEGVFGDNAVIRIGTQGTQTSTFIAGIEGTPLAGTPVVVTASGQLGTGSASVSDHGGLTGLADDDHTQYLLTDGTRALTGALSAGGNKLTNLAAAAAPGDAVRFEQAVLDGDAAGGDLSGTLPNPTVAKLQGTAVSATAPTTGQVLTHNGTAWTPTTPVVGVTDHSLLTGLTADDHTQYLLANGVRDAANGFAVSGTFGQGSIPVSGGGTRLMWYPRKAAFRVGQLCPTCPDWNDAYIGGYSVAMGYQPRASGNYSFALGQYARTSGHNSAAVGYYAEATGDYGMAIGRQVNADGDMATAMGYSTTAGGTAATALGGGTNASADYSTALGRNTTASQHAATAMGEGTTADAQYATAIGYNTTAQAFRSIVLGQYNLISGSQFSWVATDPLFVVGNGTSSTPANALTLLKDGKLGIGTETPADLLDVAGDIRVGTGTDGCVKDADGDVIAGTCVSDIRLKKNITSLPSVLPQVTALRPVHFNWRADEFPDRVLGNETQLGLIAQEVEQILPELVVDGDDGFKRIRFNDLPVLLLQAIKEQQRENEDLKARVANLETTLQRLESAIAGMER